MEAQLEETDSVELLPIQLFVEALKDNDPERAISYLSDPVFRQHTSLGDCLIECAKYGNFTTLDYILNLRCRIHPSLSYTDKMKKRALHHASVHGPLESVMRLIRAGSIVNCCDIEGYTPLLCACQGGRPDIVQCLLREGAHINSSRTYKYGETALHIASKHGHPEIIRMLLHGRADINAITKIVENEGRHTPLHKAALGCHSRVIDVLCEGGARLEPIDAAGRTALHYSAEKGDIASVEILIRFGASINAQDEMGKTPLALAIREGYPDIVKTLIFCGANVNLGDRRGLTPLHSSIMAKNYEIADILLKADANVNAQTSDTNETPLMVSLSMGSPDLLQLLLDHGADVNLTDFKYYSPLHRSQTVGFADDIKEELTELVLQGGVKLNARDNQGHIPLHRSIFTGAIRGRQCAPCIRQLVEAGAQLKPDKDAHTRNSPLYWLCSSGELKIARYLVQCGWEVQSESWIKLPGKTPEQTHLHQLFRILSHSCHSLKRLCREVVREQVLLATNDREIVSSIMCLPIPQTVKNYLCLKTCEISDDDDLLMQSH